MISCIFFFFFRANGFDKIVLCKWKEFVKITIFKFKIFEISVNTVQVKWRPLEINITNRYCNPNINSPFSQFMELICALFLFWTLYIFFTLFFRWQESEITQQISCKEFTRITIFKDSVYANSMRKITWKCEKLVNTLGELCKKLWKICQHYT